MLIASYPLFKHLFCFLPLVFLRSLHYFIRFPLSFPYAFLYIVYTRITCIGSLIRTAHSYVKENKTRVWFSYKNEIAFFYTPFLLDSLREKLNLLYSFPFFKRKVGFQYNFRKSTENGFLFLPHPPNKKKKGKFI